jgi:ATP synthase subunit 6
MLNSPLEQFEIVPVLGFQRGDVDLSRTNSALMMLIAVGLRVMGMQSLRVGGHGSLVPNRWQTVVESMYGLVMAVVAQTLGPLGSKYFPFVFTLFTFVLACNLLGLVPYSFTVTSHLVVTLTLARAIWVGKLVIGIRAHGIKLWSMFLPEGTPFAMYPMMVPLELLGFTITFISLSVRLFANMMAGHILLKVIAGFAWTMMTAGGLRYLAHFVPMLVLFVLFILETAVAFIQAYVFTLLTCIYIGDMERGGH